MTCLTINLCVCVCYMYFSIITESLYHSPFTEDYGVKFRDCHHTFHVDVCQDFDCDSLPQESGLLGCLLLRLTQTKQLSKSAVSSEF